MALRRSTSTIAEGLADGLPREHADIERMVAGTVIEASHMPLAAMVVTGAKAPASCVSTPSSAPFTASCFSPDKRASRSSCSDENIVAQAAVVPLVPPSDSSREFGVFCHDMLARGYIGCFEQHYSTPPVAPRKRCAWSYAIAKRGTFLVGVGPSEQREMHPNGQTFCPSLSPATTAQPNTPAKASNLASINSRITACVGNAPRL